MVIRYDDNLEFTLAKVITLSLTKSTFSPPDLLQTFINHISNHQIDIIVREILLFQSVVQMIRRPLARLLSIKNSFPAATESKKQNRHA